MSPKILAHLNQDPILAQVLDGGVLKSLESGGLDSKNVYHALVRSIVYQQLSTKAASTIYKRFLALFEKEYPAPDLVLAFDMEQLRSVGLSRQKANYIQNVATFFRENEIEHKDWSDWEDEALIKYFSQIKGVGPWTVEMILMFYLGREDVLPLRDLAIEQTMVKLYHIEASKKREIYAEMTRIAEAWRPYRSIACRYLYRWKDR